MAQQIFKPEPNTKYVIALKYPKPQLVNGRWGMQCLWILADGRRMYTPKIVQERIEAEGIKPGQAFSLCKALEDGQTDWLISRGQSPAAALLDGAGPLDSPIPDQEPDEDPPPIPLTRLEHALKTAVSAAHKAELEGLKIGYNVRFTPSDIRAMAISVLIGMDRRAA